MPIVFLHVEHKTEMLSLVC